MKNRASLKIILVFILALASMGCVRMTLQKKINSRTYQPVLVNTSEIVKEKSPKTIRIQYTNDSIMPATSVVDRKSWFLIDLIILYYYNYNMVINLGNNSCTDATSYFKKSMVDIMNRSGNFTLTVDSLQNKYDYKAIISIKPININCKYRVNGFAFGYFQTRSELAEKSQGDVQVNLKLLNSNNELVLEKSYRDASTVNFVSSTKKIREIKYAAMQNLLEKFTNSIQSIGLEITKDLNTEITKE